MNEQIKDLTQGKKPVMIILMGLPATGKSTFCARYLPHFMRINLDTLGTRHRENEELDRAIMARENIVIDNTNVTAIERRRYTMKAYMDYWIYGIFFKSVIRDCVARNAQREGSARVPTKAIAAKSNQLQFPHMSEDFDGLYFAEQQDNDFIITPWIEEK